MSGKGLIDLFVYASFWSSYVIDRRMKYRHRRGFDNKFGYKVTKENLVVYTPSPSLNSMKKIVGFPNKKNISLTSKCFFSKMLSVTLSFHQAIQSFNDSDETSFNPTLDNPEF